MTLGLLGILTILAVFITISLPNCQINCLRIVHDIYGPMFQSITSYLDRGNKQFKVNNYEQALKSFQLAETTGKPDAGHMAKACYGAGACLLKLKRWDEALETFQKAKRFSINGLSEQHKVTKLIDRGLEIVNEQRANLEPEKTARQTMT